MKRITKLALAFVLITVLFVWTLPMKSWACELFFDCWMTDTEGQPIPGNTFDIVLKKNGTVSSTNPGGFFYNIEVYTEGAFNSLTISASLPPEFDFHGGNPVKVFLDGVQVYNGSNPSYTLTNVPAYSRVVMRVHVKYVKGLVPPPCPHTYVFDADISSDPVSESEGSTECTLTHECP